ncbi:CAB/ELIP/HLIP-related protein [Calothrix sp. NIES-2100]|nr:CAB/ELIP/HLIP-related protein [Calothrix sp. NIES-2100]
MLSRKRLSQQPQRLQTFHDQFRLPKIREELLMMTQPKPTITPKLEEPKLGFNEYAERLNGRAAMIGFILMVVIEYVTNQGVLSWLGLK